MLETVAAGLILAAVSGITYLAYKHPPAFRKLFYPMLGLIIAPQIILGAWALGVSHSYATIYRFIDRTKWNEADAAINSITPREWLVSLVLFGSLAYLAFLRALPLLIHEKKEAEPDHERPEEKD